jgi:hypothetical protein
MTVTLDEQLARRVRQQAANRGMSVSAFIAKTLDDALNPSKPPEPPPFQLVTVRGVYPQLGVDLDRVRELEAQDDESDFVRGR